jgi:hypothetical protein
VLQAREVVRRVVRSQSAAAAAKGIDPGRGPVRRNDEGDDVEMADQKKIPIVDDDDDVRRGPNIRRRANGYATVFAGDGVARSAWRARSART